MNDDLIRFVRNTNPMRENGVNFLHLFGNNGWVWQRYNGWADEDYYKYKATFLGIYSIEVYAVVAANYHHLRSNGELGVLWLEVAGYPDCTRDENIGYSIGDLNDMITGLIKAEENLIRCGIPFTSDYDFISPNKANLKRRNTAIRKKLDLKHLEELEWQRLEEVERKKK